MTRRDSTEAGFTMIELLIVVAMIAILAAIALPMFLGETRKAKSATEVPAYFSDIQMRLQQFYAENGTYPVDGDESEATTWPVAPSPTAQAINPLPVPWQNIRIVTSGTNEVYCGYTWVTGLANDAANIGPIASTQFSFVAPTTDWYYVLAHCDLDGDPGTDSFYFASSIDPKPRSVREGN